MTPPDPDRPPRPPLFGRRHRIVILLLAAIAAGLAFGFALSFFFGTPAQRTASNNSATATSQATDPAEDAAPLVGTGLPWGTVEGRADRIIDPLPGGENAPPSILYDRPAESAPPQMAALPPATETPLPEMQPLPLWKRHAATVDVVPGRPMVAVVIDDLGMDRQGTQRAVDLPAAVTMAFLPYAPDVAVQAAAARKAGHELLVHVSMEPRGGNNSGPNTLEVDLAPDELRKRLDWALGRFTEYVGINNHMGSRFTADVAGMDVVLTELRARGLLFLDSRTTRDTVGFTEARRLGVPAASRRVFLDDTPTPEAVLDQLAELEQRARESGHAIAIGHPYDVTLAALEAWLPTLAEKGIQLVPVSALVEDAAAQ